jgi:hypothetical protein
METTFYFENAKVRVEIQKNGGVYARDLTPRGGVIQASPSEHALKRLHKAWEATATATATMSDFWTSGEKIRGVKFFWRSN